ncbi:hypothetical protein [Streptomyces montanisoli]|uniref:Uncharacterized protein n=1 Tax=Streptomyces montanisoli TaxID=2798581 RepID=A0A940MA47_9ACTN|nr:hypothetical protein [Streptomyces montanisoli]MBP0459105.1 hypothetical protein [Streptomyces montanisoli]
MLTYTKDTSPAAWLFESGASVEHLALYGPAAFQEYARLRYIPDPTGPGLAGADVQLPDDHPTEIEQARRVLRALGAHTRTPDRCFFCLWEGYGEGYVDLALTRGPLVITAGRRHVLYTGVLDEVENWEAQFGEGGPCPPPAYVWPADHRWCFTSDVDPHWAGIGADTAAIEALTARTDVDVVRCSPADPVPYYEG